MSTRSVIVPVPPFLSTVDVCRQLCFLLLKGGGPYTRTHTDLGKPVHNLTIIINPARNHFFKLIET